MPNPLRTFESKGVTSPRSDVPLGMRVSAIILVLLALALGLGAVFCVIAIVLSPVHPGQNLFALFLGLVGIVALAAAFVCLRAARSLRNAGRWGANVATVFGGLAVASSSLELFNFFRHGGQSADEYFLYPVAPIFLLLGTWLCVYLNLPRVRAGFEKHSNL
jgi:hypothetical protein